MKNIVALILVLLTACRGKLTDDQRRRLNDGMKKNVIRKVTEAQMTDEAFKIGRIISSSLKTPSNKKIIDSVEKQYHVKIRPIYPDAAHVTDLESQIAEAYSAGSANGELNDNVQKLKSDSLFYTKPILKEFPDGSQHFSFAWGIWMAKKQIVFSMED